MTKAQAIAELERIQELLPLIAEAVKEERKPVNRYANQWELLRIGNTES